VLLLDDLHFFDLASWQVLVALCLEVTESCMVVTTMRNASGVLNSEMCEAEESLHWHRRAMDNLEQLMDIPSVVHMAMQAFTKDEVRRMMQARLPGCHVHESNVEAVFQQTRGHPMHIEEIINYIESLGSSAYGKLAEVGGFLSSNLSALAARSMSHVIVSRIDRLRPTQQLTLKICSVIGLRITMDLLLRTYPLVVDSKDHLHRSLLEDLHILCQAKFLQHDRVQGIQWKWNSALAQDVVYGIIPYNQRRLLHSRLAKALEDNLNHTSPTSHIAHHWTKSCTSVESLEWQRALNAIQCWKKAAEEMEAQGSHLDAIRFMTKALELTRLLLASCKDADTQDLEPPAFIRNGLVSMLEVSLQHQFIAGSFLKLARLEMVRSAI
jgi:predicted ATPase